jgi:PIN domain-containing protein
MKRCPECNRVETDETLGFCRVDGKALIGDSSSVSGAHSPVKPGSASTLSEIETRILPTDETLNRVATPTDANLDFVDALIAATAERLNIKRLLTLDRRDFKLIRPRHCGGFELLP